MRLPIRAILTVKYQVIIPNGDGIFVLEMSDKNELIKLISELGFDYQNQNDNLFQASLN